MREVERLATSMRRPHRTPICLLTYGDLRWGEVDAFRHKRYDLLRSRTDVTESLPDARVAIHFDPVKTHRRRVLIILWFLDELMAEHLAHDAEGGPDALVFTSPEGQPLRTANIRRHVQSRTLADAEFPDGLRVRDIRHTCSSLLIAQDAHPQAIQNRLGHSSITMTTDRYGHLLPSSMKALAVAFDDVRSRTVADQTRTKRGPRTGRM